MNKNTGSVLSLMIVMGLCATGCETKAQTGALVGAGTGAAIGGLIGSTHRSSAGAGAAIGAGVGAIGGYLVGNEMDKKDQREGDRDRTAERRPTRSERNSSSASNVTQKDVIAWTNDGVKDEVIIDRIERSGSVFRLTAADENKLRDAGVSEEVVRAMKNTSRRG